MYMYSYIVIYMPAVPTYIRNKDYTNWLAIKDRPAFLHSVLHGPVYAAWILSEGVPEDGVREPSKKIIKTPEQAQEAIKGIKATPVTYKDTNNWGA